ncbi:MAG: DNA repair protein RecO [Firmicutes bacterium HGW-Firmicutes-7]|nr:MAG: DNA repair protein RecO [Firmicutes bacterium HGW-Firmicutes-7]
MGAEIVTKALVLHEMPISDYDKRLILLTKDYGKITTFAKGAKKSNSKLLAGSQIFCYGDFHIYKGRNTYNINQVSLIEPFYNLRKNIDALTYGLYILEFVEFISVENNADHEIMKLVLKTLKQLELGHISLALIIKIFELKAMSYMGLSPWVKNCILCNSTENLNYFSSKDGGVLCNECRTGKNTILINKGTKYTLEYILEYPIEQLFRFELDGVIFDQFKLVMEQFIEYNLNKKFKALDFLKLEY